MATQSDVMRILLHNYYLYLFYFLTLSCLVSAQSENYIINMDVSSMPKAFANHHAWYSASLLSASSVSETQSPSSTLYRPSNSNPKLLYSYSNVINGYSASLTPKELEAIKSSPGYISAIRDLPVTVDTTHSFKFLGLNPDSGAWQQSDYGKDVIIGVVDTGVWPESPSFTDDGMPEVPSRWKGVCEAGTQFNSSLCNKKLIGARFFNKGLQAKLTNGTIAMNSTRDTDGHGTHTSSTAAGNFVDGASYFGYANGTARGMAPRAHVAMYKALWEEGVFTSDIIAAIDQALDDGVDVLSLSFGLSGVPLYEDPIAIATFSALEKGVFIATSAGNEGPFYGSLHNGIPWVLTVAAGTMDRDFYGILNLGNGVSISGPSLYPGNLQKILVPIVFMGMCNNVKSLKQVGRKIVVCQDKNDSLSTQYYNVETAKVFGCVFITNNTDLESLFPSSYPAIFVSPEDGEAIKHYIKGDAEAKASMSFRNTVIGTKPAPKATSFTSRGPSPSCPEILKPDIMAPGSLILAAWPPNSSAGDADGRQLFSQFDLLSGTSMACPHAAGVAALVKGARPEWSPAAIRSALMTTSDVYDNSLNPITDIAFENKPATPLAMGSGHIDPNKAVDPGLIYDVGTQDYVNVLCALNYTVARIKVITKWSSSEINCSKPLMDLNYPSFIAFFNASDSNSDERTVKEFRRTVTNVGEPLSTYLAIISPMKGFQVSVVPQKLVFIEKNEKKRFTLSIEGPRLMKERVVFGYLTWVDNANKHVVRSPMVATSLDSTVVS